MLITGRHLYVVFLCHLALEKMLKAHVTEQMGTVEPRTHDLIYLVKLSGLSLSQSHLEFVGKINNASTAVRYPDDLARMLHEYPEPVVRGYMQQTEEIVKWLAQHPNLQS